MDIKLFRQETRAWLEENCPQEMRLGRVHFEDGAEVYGSEAGKLWQARMAEKGWTVPLWEKRYGGAALSTEENNVLLEEMARINALPGTTGMGLWMLGPLLLEIGTEEQRMRHLPPVARGEVGWCQGYSEPGAGSDLAGLQTRAVLEGDSFIINGQKVWTGGANWSDWMFALVRTDPNVPKHDGISFVLLDLHQPGVTVKPIRLISGSSPFCEVFFDQAVARRDDLVGELNKGWSVAKRLLQYERGPIDSGAGQKQEEGVSPLNPLAALAKRYVGEADGKIADYELRDRILRHNMRKHAIQSTGRLVQETAEAGKAPGAVTSLFKYLSSNQTRAAAELTSYAMGAQGAGWEGASFSDEELLATRSWLRERAPTIHGGSNEIQLNIIAKRILGLPD